ncbi:MAG: FAD-dependent oxidoreductase [Bryobacterales bacterium]|nr:FAD-dependent oxidoreductase [Bryobacterales bacterium]
MLSRRVFLSAVPASILSAGELRCDVAIMGGSFGGVAAALGALRNGQTVIMTEETDWIGGQTTSQSVPPDEHPWIEQFGGTAAYKAYRRAVRDYYRTHFPLTAEARARWDLNPGDGNVSRIAHEPRVSLAVLEGMLAPYLGGGQLTVLLNHKPIRADVDGDKIRAVTTRNLHGGGEKTIHATYFLDATEQGDLLPLTKTEYVVGFESKKQTGELHAPDQAQPQNIQSFTVCYAVDYLPGQDHTIDKPEEYAFWRDYVPQMKPAWPGKLLSWQMSDPISLKVRNVHFNPDAESGKQGQGLNLFLYRRIANKRNFAAGRYVSDISLINWPQNDYWLGNIHEVSDEEAARHLRRAKQLSLALLYWMQTEAPRPDGGAGFKGLRLRPDITGTDDGMAKYPYIRESRRIQAEFTVVEEHVGTEARMKATGESREEVSAAPFDDSVGVGSYRIDLHPSSGGDNYIDVSSLPFQIPLGALIPKRMENLIPACKNLGVTHITNGCYRLHPVEWNIGESAGSLAAHAILTKQTPRQIRNSEKNLRAFQSRLTQQGVELQWPRISPR